MRKIIRRLFELKLPKNRSAFLWGPRKVGKSYWITHSLPKVPFHQRSSQRASTPSEHSEREGEAPEALPAPVIDLLKTEVFAEYASRPSLLRERYQNTRGLIVIDEIQKVPSLLDEVHWLIENSSLQFLLTGSSARKLRHGHANLLAGRAWRREMTPLSFLEVEGFDLEEVMSSGLLPPHYLSENPIEDLRAYVADYLKEEIASEALTRNIPAFTEFLRVAALTSAELLNYANVAREVGVSPKVVRTYFDILEDTLLGFRIPPWKKSKNRRLIETEKFYLFDVGLANYLARRQPKIGSEEFGKSFEHYILMELRCYQAYRNPDLPITFWRSSSGQEVDFILGDKDLALKVKGSRRVHAGDLGPMKALQEDGPIKKCIVVCLEEQPRVLEKNIKILPWKIFLEKLWGGEFD